MDVKNRVTNMGVGISDRSKMHAFSRTAGNPSVSTAVVRPRKGKIICPTMLKPCPSKRKSPNFSIDFDIFLVPELLALTRMR